MLKFFIGLATVWLGIGLPCFAFPMVALGATTLGGPESVAEGRYHHEQGLKGMVVSDDHLASEWGAEILRKGGNAVDAAVGTAFALSVTRPHYASLGGGRFLLFCPAPKESQASSCYALDYREKAPSKGYRDMFI